MERSLQRGTFALAAFLSLASVSFVGDGCGKASGPGATSAGTQLPGPTISSPAGRPSGVPTPPTGLTVVSAAVGRVVLSWNPTNGAIGYQIFRSTTSGGPYTLAGTTAGTTFADGNPSAGVPNYYVVQAVNGAGASHNSAEVAATPAAPPQASREICLSSGGSGVIQVYDAGKGGNTPPIRQFGPWMSMINGISVDATNKEVWVANPKGQSISAFPADADGVTPPLRTIVGPNTLMDGPHAVAVDPVHDEVFVDNSWAGGTDRILVFSRTADGNVAPVRSFNPGMSAYAIAYDPVHGEIWVTNYSNQVRVFDRLATGNPAPLRDISGGNTNLSSDYGIWVDTVHDEVYIVNGWTNSTGILVFSRTANGNVAPLRMIGVTSNTATKFGSLRGVAVDTAHNLVFAADWGDSSVKIFPRTANGDVGYSGIITGQLTVVRPHSLTFDPGSDTLWVPNHNTGSISVFSSGARGEATPLRQIGGTLSGARQMALDRNHQEIVVGSGSSYSNRYADVLGGFVAVYSRLADLNSAPLRLIVGPSTGLRAVPGVAVDTKNNELVVLSTTNSGTENSVAVFPRTANGNATPLRVINGGSTGLSGYKRGVLVDTVHDEIFVAGGWDSDVSVFSRTANGNVVPLRDITCTMSGAYGIDLDLGHDELFVADAGNGEVYVFNRTDNGCASPMRTISGGATGLSQPRGVAVDAAHDEIFVSDSNGSDSNQYSIKVFPRTADGNVAPSRVIMGPESVPYFPFGMLLCK